MKEEARRESREIKEQEKKKITRKKKCREVDKLAKASSAFV
jgi:hypothetical protein